MLSDVRFALRLLFTRRWFSAAIIVTLALGIGINTTVFTLVNAVLFKPVPLPGGERLVTIATRLPDKPDQFPRVTWLDFVELQQQSQSFADIAALRRSDTVISETGVPPARIHLARITPNLFPMLQTPPLAGRGFSPADGQPGAAPVALLGHDLWQNRYDGDLAVIGRTVQIEGRPATIIGIMPAGLRFPNDEDLWTALGPDGAWAEDRTENVLELFALRKPGVSLEEAQADLNVIARRLATSFPATNADRGFVVRTFHDTYNDGTIRVVFLMMLVAVGFVLFIACANVANMMLSRALERTREFALRVAVGASRAQLIRQLLVECVLLSCLGGGLGLALSLLGTHAFDLATRDVGKPYWVQFDMNWVAFAYFGTLSVLSGIVFGLVPALRASRVDLNHAIKASAGTGGARGGRLAGLLVTTQFALTVVLLAGAGLMMRSFFRAQETNDFARSATLLTARVELPGDEGERYADPAARRQFFDTLLPRLAALPGVVEAAVVSDFPGMDTSTRDIEIEGRPVPESTSPARASLIVESANYVSLINLPVILGRGLTETDGPPGHENVVVSRAFAARHWPADSALGQRFRLRPRNEQPGPWLTIVGISADLLPSVNQRDTPPEIHLPRPLLDWSWMGLLLRTTGDPSALALPVRAAVQALDPDLPVFQTLPLTEVVRKRTWFLRVFGTLFSVFALTGLVMASVGIYAVMAQHTGRRTREIGIRMALGSTARGILQLVLRRGLIQLAVGLSLGLAGAGGAARLLDSIGFIVGPTPYDPDVFIAITLLLAGIGVLACWLPARRAARLDPTVALRAD